MIEISLSVLSSVLPCPYHVWMFLVFEDLVHRHALSPVPHGDVVPLTDIYKHLEDYIVYCFHFPQNVAYGSAVPQMYKGHHTWYKNWSLGHTSSRYWHTAVRTVPFVDLFLILLLYLLKQVTDCDEFHHVDYQCFHINAVVASNLCESVRLNSKICIIFGLFFLLMFHGSVFGLDTVCIYCRDVMANEQSFSKLLLSPCISSNLLFSPLFY